MNWHDRSIASERLWGDFYLDLLAKLRERGAWFATADQAVAWFRRRRSAVFESVSWSAGAVRVKIAVDPNDKLPDLRLRIYNGRETHQDLPLGALAADSASGLALRNTCVTLS